MNSPSRVAQHVLAPGGPEGATPHNTHALHIALHVHTVPSLEDASSKIQHTCIQQFGAPQFGGFIMTRVGLAPIRCRNL